LGATESRSSNSRPFPPMPRHAPSRAHWGRRRAPARGRIARRMTRVLLVGSTATTRRDVLATLELDQADATLAGPDGAEVLARHTAAHVELFSCDSHAWPMCGPIDAVICAVASAHPAGVAAAEVQLAPLLAAAELAGAPLLVLAEGQDAPQAVPAWRVAEDLVLHESGRPWSVQGCCRARRDDVFEGVQWLMSACARVHNASARGGPRGTWLSRAVQWSKQALQQALEHAFRGVDDIQGVIIIVSL